jgi:hypothetical protein
MSEIMAGAESNKDLEPPDHGLQDSLQCLAMQKRPTTSIIFWSRGELWETWPSVMAGISNIFRKLLKMAGSLPAPVKHKWVKLLILLHTHLK